MREAPSRVILAELARRGARVVAYDPVAMPEARRAFGDVPWLAYASSPMEAVAGADALVIVTEWKEFRSPDFETMRASLKAPLIFDGRNMYDPSFVQGRGLRVLRDRASLGVPMTSPADTARFSAWRERVARARVLVVGDVMLDRYWFGDVERISPEAPVPVVRIARSEERPGGAANVARNVAALGAQATLLSVTGDDEAGATLARLVAAEGVRTSFHRDPELATTVKLRVIGRQQQLLRIDFETAPSHEVLSDHARRVRAAARGCRPRHLLRLRQGRTRAHLGDDRAGARRRAARCSSIPRATTGSATGAPP